MSILIMVFGTFVLSTLAAQQLPWAKTEGGSEKIVPYADFARLSLSTDRLKLDHDQPAASQADRERVEVLARSITFPPVLNQGDLLISREFPTATILCLVASYYAGRVQGLIWAMDRDTVVEHELYGTIDDAADLFDSCLRVFLGGAFSPQNAKENRLEDVKEVLSKQIQLIQKELRYAKNIKIATRQIEAK